MASVKQLAGLSAAAAYAAKHVAAPLVIKDSFLRTFWVYLAVSVLINVIYVCFIRPFVLSPFKGLPSPPNAHWLFGQGPKIAKEPTGIPLREWNNTIPNDGLITYRGWFNIDRLLVTGPSALREVLVTKSYDFVKPAPVRRALSRLLGVGVLLAEGDEHKRQRKHLSPAFAFRHIKDLYPQFWDKSVEMVDRIGHDIKNRGSEWTKEPNVIEFNDYTSRATLDIIGLTGMGQDFGAIENPDSTLSQHYRTVFHPPRWIRYLQIVALVIPPWILQNLPIERNRQIVAARNHIRDTCQTAIDAKRKAMAEKRPGYDILSVALESGGFTDENLTDQMMTFLAAGHETTSTALTWAMYLLSKDPERQKKLRDEIHEKLASPHTSAGKTINSTDIDSLPYLNAVCSETLRLWSPVSMTMRVAAKDTSIQSQHVPKGTLVIVSPWAVNTSYELWGDDAMEFRPERWMKDSPAVESNFAFLTFLHGPRSCIGERFSRSEFACLLAACVGRFEWEPEVAGYVPKIGGQVTARPEGGLWVRVKEIESW